MIEKPCDMLCELTFHIIHVSFLSVILVLRKSHVLWNIGCRTTWRQVFYLMMRSCLNLAVCCVWSFVAKGSITDCIWRAHSFCFHLHYSSADLKDSEVKYVILGEWNCNVSTWWNILVFFSGYCTFNQDKISWWLQCVLSSNEED